MNVIFRKFNNGEVIAWLPEVDVNKGMCMSYMHVGQHGEGIYPADTVPATEAEYGDGEAIDANAERIIACVNACQGINPEAVPDMLEALKAIESAIFEGDPHKIANCLLYKIKPALDKASAKAVQS